MKYVKTEILLRQAALDILILFENLLEAHNIYIPDDDRTGEEGEACLYGTTYFDLEDSIVDLLKDFATVAQDHPDARLNDNDFSN